MDFWREAFFAGKSERAKEEMDRPSKRARFALDSGPTDELMSTVDEEASVPMLTSALYPNLLYGPVGMYANAVGQGWRATAGHCF